MPEDKAPGLVKPPWFPPLTDPDEAGSSAPAPQSGEKQPSSLSASGNSLVDPALVARLVADPSIKITPENAIATGMMPGGRIVWLESGNADTGLQHIISDHGEEFTTIGVSKAQIPQVVMDALTKGTFLETQGKDRSVYSTLINGQAYRIAISVGSNGYIVGATMGGRI